MSDVIVPLTADERTVLEIAAHGQPIAAIGRWEKSCYSLAEKAYLQRENQANYWITQAGKDAMRDTEAADDSELASALVKTHNMRAECVAAVEKLVLPLVLVARVSAQATGDAPATSLRKWIDELREECLRRLASGE